MVEKQNKFEQKCIFTSFLMRTILESWSKYTTGCLSIHLFKMIQFCFSGESIKCWVCRSDGDPKCADPFDNTSFPITDCKQEKPREHLPGLLSTMCRKVRQKGSKVLFALITQTDLQTDIEKLAIFPALTNDNISIKFINKSRGVLQGVSLTSF